MPQPLGCGRICHLADLTITEGMKTLPVDIDQLFIDVFYYFFHSSKRKQEFLSCDDAEAAVMVSVFKRLLA